MTCHNETHLSHHSFLLQLSGSNVSLLVSVTGSDIVKVTEVTLFDSSGPTEVNGSLQVCQILPLTNLTAYSHKRILYMAVYHSPHFYLKDNYFSQLTLTCWILECLCIQLASLLSHNVILTKLKLTASWLLRCIICSQVSSIQKVIFTQYRPEISSIQRGNEGGSWKRYLCNITQWKSTIILYNILSIHTNAGTYTNNTKEALTGNHSGFQHVSSSAFYLGQ